MRITFVLIAGGSGTAIFRLGGPGGIVVGRIGDSVIPIPGGMDAFMTLFYSAPSRVVGLLRRNGCSGRGHWLHPFLYALTALEIPAEMATLVYCK